MRRRTNVWGQGALFAIVLGGISGCGARAAHEGVAEARQALGAPLAVTEVAQATNYAGSTADKVEVFCGSQGACSNFKVCDTAASGASADRENFRVILRSSRLRVIGPAAQVNWRALLRQAETWNPTFYGKGR